jgi:cell division protein FtsL
MVDGDARRVRSLDEDEVLAARCPARVDDRSVFVGDPDTLTSLLKSPTIGRPRHAARRTRTATSERSGTSEPAHTPERPDTTEPTGNSERSGTALPAWASLGVPRRHWAVRALIALNRAATRRDSLEHRWTGLILRNAVANDPAGITAAAIDGARRRLSEAAAFDAVHDLAVPAGAELGFASLGVEMGAEQRAMLVAGARQLLTSFSPSFEGLDTPILLDGLEVARDLGEALLEQPGSWAHEAGSPASGTPNSGPTAERVAVYLLTTLAMFTNNVAAATAHAAQHVLCADEDEAAELGAASVAATAAALLRSVPPVPFMFPAVLSDTPIGPITARPTDVIFACVATANRLLARRPGSEPADPYGFSFGVGQMRCPGREVAIQAQTGAVSAVLRWRAAERFELIGMVVPADIVAVPTEIRLGRRP